MAQSATLGALGAALAKAQGQIAGAAKDESNPFFKSKYADLASVWAACRGPLSANGLSVVQTTEITADKEVLLITTLVHSSGEWVSGSYPIWPVKNDPQGYGSAVTYARRYSLAAMVGVFQVDDDGNTASSDRRGVHPGEPGIDDGYREEGVEIPYGKLARQLVHRADPAELRAYVMEIEEKAKRLNKPVPKWAEPVIAAAEPIIAAWENSADKPPAEKENAPV